MMREFGGWEIGKTFYRPLAFQYRNTVLPNVPDLKINTSWIQIKIYVIYKQARPIIMFAHYFY